MKLFSTVEDVKKVFLEESMGGNSIAREGFDGVRLEDLDKHANIIERFLKGSYNQINGYSFSEVMECVKNVNALYNTNEYLIKTRAGLNFNESCIAESGKEKSDYMAVSEDFAGTQIAQAPFPVPSVAMAMYKYEQTVLPFLAHLYNLQGIRGFIYYQNIFAENAKGNVEKDKLLGSPKQIADVQPVGFVGTKKTNEEIATTVVGQTAYHDLQLAVKPVMPGTVTIIVAGKTGHFTDIANAGSRKAGKHPLLSVDGNLGHATIDYKEGKVDLDLAEAPATGGIQIVATYDREVQTVEDGAGNIAKVRMELESKTVKAEDFSVQTTANVQTEALAKAVFGLDWNRELNRMLAQLFNRELGNKIIAELHEAVDANLAKGVDQTFVHDMMNGIVAEAPTDITALGGNNNLFNIWMLPFVVNKLNKIISVNSGIQAQNVNTILVGQDVVPIIKGLKEFVEVQGTIKNQSGTALIGKYRGVPVLAGYDPIIADNELTGLYKDPEKDFLAPYAVGTFLAPFIRDIYDNQNLAVGRKQLIASCAGTVCAERLVARGTLANIDKLL